MSTDVWPTYWSGTNCRFRVSITPTAGDLRRAVISIGGDTIVDQEFVPNDGMGVLYNITFASPPQDPPTPLTIRVEAWDDGPTSGVATRSAGLWNTAVVFGRDDQEDHPRSFDGTIGDLSWTTFPAVLPHLQVMGYTCLTEKNCGWDKYNLLTNLMCGTLFHVHSHGAGSPGFSFGQIRTITIFPCQNGGRKQFTATS